MFVRAIKTVAFNQRDGRATFKLLLALANACGDRQKEARQTSPTPPPRMPWLANPDWLPFEAYFDSAGYGRGPCPALWAYVNHLADKEDKERAQKRARTGSSL
jgi:hypothetical protein